MRGFIVLCVACLFSPQAWSEVTFEWVTVGNVGNPADPGTGDGSVDYVYQISKFEVTNAQYAEFLTAVLLEGNVVFPTSDQAEQAVLWAQESIDQIGAQGAFSYQPVVGRELYPASMTFLDSMRFVNWLENGQPDGVPGNVTTEAGTYNVFEGATEVRGASATYAIPTWDEWYKAAYHDPSKSGSQYWLYPNGSDTLPSVKHHRVAQTV